MSSGRKVRAERGEGAGRESLRLSKRCVRVSVPADVPWRWDDWEGVSRWLRFLERWQCGRLFDSEVVDAALCLWVRGHAARLLREGDGEAEFWGALRAACRQAVKNFRSLRGSAFSWEPRRGSRLSVVREVRWVGSCGGVPPLRSLRRAAGLLGEVGRARKHGSVRVSRGSGEDSAVRQEERGEGLVFRCSASRGAGLAGHEPFLRALVRERPRYVVFPSRSRLGRSGWPGAADVLAACGVTCQFSSERPGADRAGQTRVEWRRESARAWEGTVALPGWVGVGEPLGEVRLVRGSGVRALTEVRPGDDKRAEHFLLELAVRGTGTPVAFGPWSTSGAQRRRLSRSSKGSAASN